MIFMKRLAGKGQTRQFSIEHDTVSGWIARVQDDRVTRASLIRDWRQVEATMALFELQASTLRQEGWTEIASSD